MGPLRAVANCYRKYFVFSGRAKRPEYWWFYLYTLVLLFGPMIYEGVMQVPEGSPLSGVLGTISMVSIAANFIPLCAVTVRRMHDGDHSGWLILLGLIPLGGLAVLFLLLLGSTPGDNQYGPPADADGVAA